MAAFSAGGTKGRRRTKDQEMARRLRNEVRATGRWPALLQDGGERRDGRTHECSRAWRERVIGFAHIFLEAALEDLRFGLSINFDERRVCILGLPEIPKLRFALAFGGGFMVIGDHLMLTLTDIQKCSVAVAAVDAKGNPAPIQGVTFAASDPAILSVSPDPGGDPTKAVVSAVGALGNAQVLVTADADLGPGVTTLQGILDVTVVASIAVALSVSVGTPESQ